MPAKKKQNTEHLEGYEFAGNTHGLTKKDAEGRFRDQHPVNSKHRHLMLVKTETIHSPVYPTNVYKVYWSQHNQDGKVITWR